MATIHEQIIAQADCAEIRDIAVGAFWIAVLAADPLRCGLASLIRPDYLEHGSLASIGYPLERKGARELLRYIRSADTVEAGIGLATLNALLPVDWGALRKLQVADMLREVAYEKHVVVIGHFPFVDDLYHVSAECRVLELNPRDGDLPADHAPVVLPEADVAVISSTTLMNGTFSDLIKLCSKHCTVFMVGGSTPLTPVLFNSGVDILAGTVVEDPMAAFRAVRQGARFPQIPGRVPVIMSRNDVSGNTEE